MSWEIGVPVRSRGLKILELREATSPGVTGFAYVVKAHPARVVCFRSKRERHPPLVRTIEKLGICPEKRRPIHSVCSIGYSLTEHKYYGWSHRAMVGFGVGDRIFQECFGNNETLFVEHGPVVIQNVNDMRQAACNFAAYIS